MTIQSVMISTDLTKSPTDAGAWDTFRTWHLIPQTPLTVEAPEVKTSYIDIPGYSKRYDFTEALQGTVPVGSRTGQWTFYVLGDWAGEFYHQLCVSMIHGWRCRCILSNNRDDEYEGRLTVDSWEPSQYPSARSATVTIGYDLDKHTVVDNDSTEASS